MFGDNLGLVLLYSALVMLIFMIIWFLLMPFKIFDKLISNVLLGTICIFVYNLVANFAKFDVIGINELSLGVLAFLGVPGFIAITVIKSLL